jgi:hypothetical protein
MKQGCMARGSHRLPRVSLGPAKPKLSTPCGWPTLKQLSVAASKAGGLRPSPTRLDTPCRKPLLIGIQQGVAMDSLKFHAGPPCPTLLPPVGKTPMKRLYSHFRGGPPAGRAAYGHLLPDWAPHAVCLCYASKIGCNVFQGTYSLLIS